ncbi:MAG: UPF0182 family protein, partial [Propionibacteriaceae bacterium]|nr:UPF0182 family protein [Propionibacteriaceae bacterium]
MTKGDALPKESTSTRRRALIPTLVIVIVIILAYYVFSEFWTRKLWFDSLASTSVFTTMLVTQVVLFAVFFAAMAIVAGLNIWLALRSKPKNATSSAQSAFADRYREVLNRYTALSILIPSVVLGAIAGWNSSSNQMTYLAWMNRQPFGSADQYFGLDISFYVFELPVWQDLLNFAQGALIVGLIAAVVVHFVIGNLSFGQAQHVGGQLVFQRGQRTRAPAAMRIQLSVLGGLWLVALGGQMLIARYGLLNQTGTLFTGMHYTDFNSRLIAYQVMAVIAFICAALFFANIFIRRLILPIASVVLMIVTGLILAMIYPAIIQNFEVKPNEPDKERPFIAAHVEATRQAFGISEVEIVPYVAVTKVSPGQLKNDAEALPGVRLIDPAVVSPTFQQLQQVRGYYTVPEELDVDRYIIDGKETDAVVAAREINLSGLPDQQWNNIHTVYTHGNG